MLRQRLSARRAIIALLGLLLALSAVIAPAAAQDRVSRLGAYSGYSTPRFNSWVRTSQYVFMRDGAMLAVDVTWPAIDNQITAEKVPVLYVHERYGRAEDVNGRIVSQAEFQPIWSLWVSHGYALVSVDTRGGGVSFGTKIGEFTDQDSQDTYDVIDWIVAQPWSNGRVGMMGVSANAIIQYLAAGAAHPALKAIVPQMGMFDMYNFVYPGGIYRYEFLQSWAQNVYWTDISGPRVPVDADADGSLARAALAEHADNIDVYVESAQHIWRDEVLTLTNRQSYQDWSPNRFIEAINQAGTVAVYQIAGWYDMWPGDMALWHANLSVPRRIVFTPYSHGAGFVKGWQQFIDPLVNDAFTDLTALSFQQIEHLRFFDYHLRDIDNGIMDEAPVWYYLMGAPVNEAWRSAESFPPPDAEPTDLFFTAGPSGSLEAAHDHGLGLEMPGTGDDQDVYTVDLTTTMGDQTRWHNGHGGPFFYEDMTEQGQRSLNYTTPPLPEAVSIAGFPRVTLWVTTDTRDADVFVYLEEVDADGHAYALSEGMLRLSYRKESPAPFADYLGLVYRRGFMQDLQPMTPGKAEKVVIDLLPTANVFDAGHRIRLRITGADAGSHLTNFDDLPTLTVGRNAAQPSALTLPVLP